MHDNISQDAAIKGEGNIVVGKGDVIINPLPPAEIQLRRELGILLKNVENLWIKGFLEKSLHEAALIELGLELREDVIDNPWRMVMEGPDYARQTLPRGSKVKDIFYGANGLLLILGEPGSGKTTTLLQLARDLIADLDKEFTQPIPVILNLSTWTNKQQPLDDWLITELSSKYRLPKKDGKRWLEDRRILPLLDGLDEVKADNRATCVENINRLVVEYGLRGLVVCSRIKDYTALNVRLAFYRAIYIQPLSLDQVDEYLNQAGEKLASLRTTLHDDENLRSMSQSPLILNIMSLAYQNTSAEKLSEAFLTTNQDRLRHLFDTYIDRMFHRKANAEIYGDEQTKQYLAWLARNMHKHNQEVFLIEGIQPTWLPKPSWQSAYIFGTRLISGLMIGVGVLILRVLWFSFSPAKSIILGIILGLCLGFMDFMRFKWLHRQTEMRKLPMFWRSTLYIFALGLVGALSADLAVMYDSGEAWFDRLLVDLGVGASFGLMFGLRSSRQNLGDDIQTVEALRWSTRKAIKGALLGVIGSLILVFIWGLIERSVWADSNVNSISVLGYGLVFGVSTGLLLNGISHEIIETKSAPNQGIRLSVRNAVVGGVISGLVVFVIPFVFTLLADNFFFWEPYWSVVLRVMITGGLIGCLGGALWYGGLDIIQHYILRSIIVLQSHFPSNFARFLDYGTDRILLQKVGGGYRFIHRLLLEHFADMYQTRKE